MKRSDITAVLLLCAVVAAVQLARVLVPESSVWSGLSGPQAAAFPIFFFGLWRLAIDGMRVPRAVLVLSAVCALGAMGFSYAWRGDRRTDFLVARLRGDEFEAESKVLRDRINGAAPKRSAVRGVRYYREIVRHADAVKALRSNKASPAIVWGGGKFLSISFPTAGGVVRLGDINPRLPVGKELAVVTRISRIDIPRFPEESAAAFIGKFLAGLLPETAVNGVMLPGSAGESEITLRDAGLVLERWASVSHRALASFALGNHYIFQVVRSGAIEPGELRCAIAVYRFGRKLFPARDNPELAMALANNEGVAAALLGAVSGDSAARKAAPLAWRMAERGPKDKQRLRAAPLARLAAQLNLAGAAKPPKKKKGRGAAEADTISSPGHSRDS